jgi:hypothetical protein
MKVYILVWCDLDGQHISGVYGTKEKAKIAQSNEQKHSLVRFSILKKEVN